jgi:hypothetical protein
MILPLRQGAPLFPANLAETGVRRAAHALHLRALFEGRKRFDHQRLGGYRPWRR